MASGWCSEPLTCRDFPVLHQEKQETLPSLTSKPEWLKDDRFFAVFSDLENGLSLEGAGKFINWQGKEC